jgi:hypothetical protein
MGYKKIIFFRVCPFWFFPERSGENGGSEDSDDADDPDEDEDE